MKECGSTSTLRKLNVHAMTQRVIIYVTEEFRG